MTREEFLVRFPEFESDGPTPLDSILAEVENELVEDDFDEQFDAAHGYLTAHRLWASPFGAPLRIDGADTSTSDYLKEFQRIVAACEAGGAGVTGGAARGW